MPSDEKVFKDTVGKCQKAFRGVPLRVVIGVLEQLFVEALGQVPALARPQAFVVVFDAVKGRVLPRNVSQASASGHTGGAVGGQPKLIVSPTNSGPVV